MATKPGLDPSNINLYGAAPADTEEYQRALQSSVDALQQRYENPNWFNVAAGFLKPQLGGFMASLGSAGQALGENLEKQRESQLPIAQMRAQLAASKIAMGQKSDAAKALSDWKATGKPMSEAIYAHIVGLAPDAATAAAAKAAYEGERANQSLRTSQQDLLSKQIGEERALLVEQRKAGTITQDEYNNGIAALRARLNERPPVMPSGTTDTANSPRSTTPPPAGTPPFSGGQSTPPIQTAPASPGPTGAISATQFDEMRQIKQSELDQAKARLAKGDPRAQGDIDALTKEMARDAAAQKQNGVTTAPTTTAAGKDDFSDFKIKPSIVLKHPQAVTAGEIAQNAAATKAAAALESTMEKQYQNLQSVNEPAAFDAAESANRFVLNELDTKPKMAADTTNMLRKAGPIAAMLQKGIGISFGPYGANISLDVLAGLRASLSEEQQNYYDGLINAVARSVYYDLKSRGIDPEKEGAEKFGQRMLQETNMEQGPAAIRHAIKTNAIRLQQNKELFSTYNEAMPGAVAEGSLSPLHDISTQHPKIKIVKGFYKKLFEQEDKTYSEGIKRKAP